MNDFDIAIPEPSALVESLRAVGYDFRTAIADIIDNSITAAAKHISLQFEWRGDASYVVIADDGTGMNANELVTAMTLGSISPKEVRSEGDLGRYGLGLKTASFSQCRVLEVYTKKDAFATIGRKWDLDYISRTGEWRLQAIQEESWLNEYLRGGHGTVVVWRQLDRLTRGFKIDSAADQNTFYREVDSVKQHLSVVFHRYLSQINGVSIAINGRKIDAWDPFMSGESTTQLLTDESLPYKGGVVRVKPYVLPHHADLSAEQHAGAAGAAGWNMQQGFYVYRNRRLLVAGDWLGLGFLKDEHYKLARIQLDLPNTMDDDWNIDIKKSHAMPPQALRKDLQRLAQLTRKQAGEVYRHRAKLLTRSSPLAVSFVWKRAELNGTPVYRINREHPIVADMLRDADKKQATLALLRLVEETLPVAGVVADWRERPADETTEIVRRQKEHDIARLADTMIAVLTGSGMDHAAALKIMEKVEPFDEFPEILEAKKEQP